jgi:hypothetical protein
MQVTPKLLSNLFIRSCLKVQDEIISLKLRRGPHLNPKLGTYFSSSLRLNWLITFSAHTVRDRISRIIQRTLNYVGRISNL